MTSKAQQIELDNAFVAPENCGVIGKCNMQINPGMKPNEPTYQVALDALTLTTCYPAFLITAEVPISSLDKIRLSRVQILYGMYYKKNLDFVALIWEELAYQIDSMDSKKQDKMFYPRFLDSRRSSFTTSLIKIIDCSTIPKAIRNQALLDSVAYKTYYAIASGAKPPKSRKSQNKPDPSISSEESPSKKKSAKAKKVVDAKPKPTKKKAPIKSDKGKGLNVLSEVALSEAAQLKETTKQIKKDFHISQASGSGDGTDFELGVPDEQHRKTSGTDEGTEEDDDDENDFEDESNNGDDDDDCDDDDDANDDDNQEVNDTNNDDEETDNEGIESDRIKIPVLNQSSTEYYEEEEDKIDDEEKMDEEEEDDITKELYKDLNVNLGNEDTYMTDVDQGGSCQQNVSQESFEKVEEDAHVTLTPVLDIQKTDEPIASLMDTTTHHAMIVLEITSIFTTTIPPPPPFFNPLPQQATPTQTPTTSVTTTSFPSLPNFSYVFKFNDRVTNLEKDLSEIKQVDQYAQALSSIPAIVDRYTNNKLGEAIQKAIVAHNLDCREEAHVEKRDYIELVDTIRNMKFLQKSRSLHRYR
ncbi:hypothetical protein Tco_0918133 [Tanacetum coccineum]